MLTVAKNGNVFIYDYSWPTYKFSRSTDEGATWETVNDIPDSTVADTLIVTQQGDIYTNVSFRTKDGWAYRTYRSTDNGMHWDSIINAHPGGLFPAGSAILSMFDGVWRSTDHALTWTQTVARAPNVYDFLISDGGSTVYNYPLNFSGKQQGLFRSVDEGATWSRVADSIEYDLSVGVPYFRLHRGAVGKDGWIYVATYKGLFAMPPPSMSVALPTVNESTLSPNPANTYLEITRASSSGSKTTLSVYGMHGALVRTIESAFESKAHRISTGDLPNGVYQLVIAAQTVPEVHRFVVMHREICLRPQVRGRGPEAALLACRSVS
jgi:hypothetical protein